MHIRLNKFTSQFVTYIYVLHSASFGPGSMSIMCMQDTTRARICDQTGRNHSNVLYCRTLSDHVCDEIQSIWSFFFLFLSLSLRFSHSLDKYSQIVDYSCHCNFWQCVYAWIDKKPIGQIKKKILIFIYKHSQKVAS